MPENKTYKANGQVYEIPESEVADFLKDFPDATEVNSFVMEKDTFDIPVNEVSSFIQDNPTAKALKKKDTPELGTSVGSESQSSGKSFQQLYQEHVTEGKEFVTPFDETPAGKVSKVDETTKKPVGAKKELANYELLYGDEYPELVQQKSLEIAEKTQWKPTLTEGENLQLQQARENVKAKEQDLQAYKESGQINMSDKQDPLAVQKANDLAKEQKIVKDLTTKANFADDKNYVALYDTQTLEPIAIPKGGVKEMLEEFIVEEFQNRRDIVNRGIDASEFADKTYDELSPDAKEVVLNAFSARYIGKEELGAYLKNNNLDLDLNAAPHAGNQFLKGLLGTTASVLEGADMQTISEADVLNANYAKARNGFITKGEYERKFSELADDISRRIENGVYKTTKKLPGLTPLSEEMEGGFGNPEATPTYTYSADQIQRWLAKSPTFDEIKNGAESPFLYENGLLGEWGENIQKLADRKKSNPIYNENFLLTKLPSGLGSAIPFIATTVAARGLNLPSAIVTAATGGAANASGTYKQAIEGGATSSEATKAYLIGFGIGTTEALPLERLMNRFGAGQNLTAKLIQALSQGTEEAIQEASTSISNDALAKFVYDESLKIGETASSDAGVGFATGLIMSAGKVLSTRKDVTPEQKAMVDKGVENLRKYIVERGETAAKKEEPIVEKKITPEVVVAEEKIVKPQVVSAGTSESDKTEMNVIAGKIENKEELSEDEKIFFDANKEEIEAKIEPSQKEPVEEIVATNYLGGTQNLEQLTSDVSVHYEQAKEVFKNVPKEDAEKILGKDLTEFVEKQRDKLIKETDPRVLTDPKNPEYKLNELYSNYLEVKSKTETQQTSPEIDEKQAEIDAQITEKKQKLAEAKAKREVKVEEPAKDEPVKVKSFKKGDGGTKGIFEGEDGKLYKSDQPQQIVQTENGYERKPIEGEKTDEYEILSELQDNPHIPKIGKVVNTTEGTAFEIEKLDEIESFTKEEYREIQKILDDLNDKEYHVGDRVTVMRRPKTGELVVIDFSSGYKGDRMSRDSEDYMQNISEKLNPSDAINIKQEDRADADRYTAEGLMKGESTTEYYLTRRPPSIGTHPTDGLKNVEETEFRGKKVWKLTYDKKLSRNDIENFELTPKITMKEYSGRKVRGVYGDKLFYVSDVDYKQGTVKLVSELDGKEISEVLSFREFQKNIDDGKYKIEDSKEEIISPKIETNVKDETKTEAEEASVQEVKTGISETISKYGWTVEPQGKDQVLRNANGKIVATVKIKGEKYQIIGNDGAKLMSGNKNVAEAVEKVATKYFMAKERVEDVKEEVVEPVKEVEVTDGKNNTEAHKQLNDFITKELEHEPNTNNIQDLPIGVENWTDKELKRFPITEAYLKFKKKYGVSPKIERTQQSKEETQPEVKEETKVEKDTGLIDGINNIRSNDGAFNLFKVAFDRGVIHESLYNDFGLELAELKKDKKGKVDTSSVAEIILKYSEKEAKKKDDSVAREEQAKINKEYEESPTDKSLDDKIAAKKADLKARKANRNNLGILSNQNENEAEILALYTDLAGLYIAKGIKSAVDFAKELGEEISDIIKEAWDKANNVEEGIPTEVETVEKEVETVENTGNSITEEEEPEEKKKALLNRGHKGAIEVDDTELAEKIEEHGLTYEPESWAEGRRKAQELIKDIGIDDAIDIVRRGHVDGAAAAFVWAEAIDAVHNQIITETDAEQIELLQQREADLLSEFDKKARDKGRFISALQDIYANSDFQYDVEQTIKEIKDKNGGEIDPKDEARIRELGEQLEAKNKEYQEAVKRAEQAEYERDVANIAESVARQGKVGMTEQEVAEAIERGVQNEFDKIMARLPAQRKKTAKKTIEALEKMDKSLSGMNFDATLGIPVAIVRGGIKTIIAAIKLTGKVADSIEAGLKHIQEEYEKQFGKKLPAAEYGRVKTFIKENLEDAGIDTSSRKDKTVKEKGGKLKIPHELIREFVESGITDANELTKAVLAEVQKQFPEATERQVRDAISQYGRTVNLNQEEVEVEIRRLKRAQRIISALEDIAQRKRPLRSGLQRDVPTSEERALQKQLKEALKTLPPDLALQEKQLKTSLDAIQKRLENQIEDLEREIETGEKAVKENRELPYTDKIKELIAERDRVKEIHEEMFGKPELTDEQRLERAIKAIDRATSKVEERIRKGELTTEPGKVLTSTEKEAAKQRLKDAQEKLRELQELAGIPEQKRLEQAKKTATRRIADLQNKIAAGDFAKKVKKPLLADSELGKLLAEKRALQHEFDKLKYKYELANRTKAQKVIDGLYEIWNLPRGLMATGEFSVVLIQNLMQTIAHPIIARNAIANMVSHLLSAKRSEAFANKLQSQSWYQDAREDKLALTEPDAKLSVREELYLSSWTNMVWDLAGRPIKLFSENAYEKWKLKNPAKAFERATVGYSNTMRAARYRDGVAILEKQGKTRESHPQDYKDLASIINTFTGRTSLGKAELASKILAIGLFSPKMWASIAKTTTPWVLYTIGSKPSYSGSNTKEGHTGKMEVSVAQKMAVADMLKFMGATTSLVLLAASYLNNDDDDETSVSLDPKSSDFMKLKIGRTRIDPWGGRQQMVVLQARLAAQAMTSTSTGETNKLGTPFKTPTGLGLMGQMLGNKQSPSMRLLTTYLNRYEGSEGQRVDKYGNDVVMSAEIEESMYPIYWGTIADIYENNRADIGTIMTMYALFGGGVSVYEQKKPKSDGGLQKLELMPKMEKMKKLEKL